MILLLKLDMAIVLTDAFPTVFDRTTILSVLDINDVLGNCDTVTELFAMILFSY